MRGTIAALLLWLSGIVAAHAQPIIGQCYVPNTNATIAIAANLYAWQVGNPANAGFAVRDPSGMTYLQLPSTNPAVGYFSTWDGRLVEAVWGMGWQNIGSCSIVPPPPPPVFFPGASSSYGVPVPGGLAALPAPIVNANQPFGLPLIAPVDAGAQCAEENSVDDPAFDRCMVRTMLGKRERAVYDCAVADEDESADPALLSACVVGALGGANERKIAGDFDRCYRQGNGSFEAFSLCMAGTQFSGDMARLVQCVSQQSTMGEVSVMGTAVCYGASSLNLNPESQIVIQCAVATGGEPEAFAGCAGGALTARELQKCRTGGIGGPDGCFGPNNDIVQYMRSAGLRLAEIYGPANPLVKAWNKGVDRIVDGAREEGVALLKTAANQAVQTTQALADRADEAVRSVMPRITVGTPRGKIFGKKFSL